MDRTIFQQPLTEISTTRKDPLGSHRFEDGKVYKYVMLKNVTATVAGVAGDPVAYAEGVTLDGYINNHTVLDVTDADSQPTTAGFLMGTVTGTAGTAYYVWLQIKGIVYPPTAGAGTPVVGSGLMHSTTDKELTKVTGVITPCAIALVTSAASGAVLADCPF